MADLTTTITESVTLNGATRGTTNVINTILTLIKNK